MSDAPARPPSDDAIRAMLTERAGRLTTQPLDVTGAFAEALRGSRQERRVWRLWPALTGGASLAALVAVALVAVILPSRVPTASSPPSAGPSVVSPASAAPLATPVVLSPGQLLEAVSASADGLVGRLVPLRGALASVIHSCPPRPVGASPCNGLTPYISDVTGGIRVRVTDAVIHGSESAGSPESQIWIVRVTNGREADGLVVELIGGLKQGPDGGLTFTVAQLLANHDESRVGSLVAVDGWLVRTPLHSCPSISSSGARYGCPSDVYLTDTEFQPLRADGSSLGPTAGIDLPADAYEQWAPEPAPFSTGGVVPQRAVYLLRAMPTTCPVGTACQSFRQAEVLGRLDPLSDQVSSPEPSDAQTVAEIIAASANEPFAFADGRQLIVHGWLVRTPQLPLCRPAPESPYGCDQLDYVTDLPFQPWSSTATSVSARGPDVGLRVQNGAYDAFAPDPRQDSDGAYIPREGTYVVRGVIRSGCETLPQPEGSVAPCAGPAVLFWEIVERR
jgi:hypothetical protein